MLCDREIEPDHPVNLGFNSKQCDVRESWIFALPKEESGREPMIMDDEYYELIRNCCQRNPIDRPDAASIVRRLEELRPMQVEI
jgi:hypothetical protein